MLEKSHIGLTGAKGTCWKKSMLEKVMLEKVKRGQNYLS
jgi:hypothetical protein